MKLQIKSLIVGFVLAYLILCALLTAFVMINVDKHMIFREQHLASGKSIKVTSFHMVWGIKHDERYTRKDSFQLEHVSSNSNGDEQILDQETLEVFELIRPISELWGFNNAYVSAFPTTERKGKYYIFNFTRDSNGKWNFDRKLSKVFVND